MLLKKSNPVPMHACTLTVLNYLTQSHHYCFQAPLLLFSGGSQLVLYKFFNT